MFALKSKVNLTKCTEKVHTHDAETATKYRAMTFRNQHAKLLYEVL